MPATSPPEGLGLPELLLLATRVVFERTHAALEGQGIAVRPAHGYTFQLLASTGGATGDQVAEHLGVTKQAASQLLEGLERSGYIARRPHPGNHRARIAVLTDAGWAAVRSGTAAWTAAEQDAERLLGPDRLGELRRALAEIAADGGALTPPLRLRPVW